MHQGKGAEREFYRAWLPAVKSAALTALLILAPLAPSAASTGDELDRSRNDEERLAAIVSLVEAGDFAGAEEALLASGEVAARDPRWLNLHGLAVAGQGHHGEAIALYEAGLRREPGLAALHRNLAISLVQAGGRGRALSEFRQATELDPGDVEAWLGLCTLQIRLRRAEDAEFSWRQLHRLAPDDVRTWRARTELAELAGDPAAAREAWLWLESHRPDADTARRLALMADAADSALGHYRDCIDRDPAAVDCREQATLIALQGGDAVAAVGFSEPALTQLTEAGYLNLLLAAMDSPAVQNVEEWVVRRKPGSAAGWGVVGLVRRGENRPEAALQAVQAGLGVAETADLHNLLGVLRLEAGDVAGARQAWARALELDPGHDLARSNLEEHPEAP